jgi:hypothetical protein
MQTTTKPNRLNFNKTTVTRINPAVSQAKNRRMAPSITTLTSRGI